MSIQKQFLVRFQESGYVRFQVPACACTADAASALSQAITDFSGVYAVKLYRSQGKLAIRYHPSLCSFQQLALQLYRLIGQLEQRGVLVAPNMEVMALAKEPKPSLKQRFKQTRFSHWWSEKTQAARETAQAAKILGRISTKGPKALIQNPEKAVIDFLNDILVLYLIRTHWTRIMQQWLPRPWQYRYEWLAVFYLFYLLVRSRKKS